MSSQSISTQGRNWHLVWKLSISQQLGLKTDATLTVSKCSDVFSSQWNLNWIYTYIDPLHMSIKVAICIHGCIIITIRDQVSPWYANYITKVDPDHCKFCESTLCTVLSKLNTADGHKGNQTAYPSKFFYPFIFYFHKWNEREQTQIIWYFRWKSNCLNDQNDFCQVWRRKVNQKVHDIISQE